MFRNKLKDMALTYKRVFDTPDGKKVLRDLMNCSNFMNSTIGRDSHETYFNEGSRSIIIRILKTTNMSIEQIEQYVHELEKGDFDE